MSATTKNSSFGRLTLPTAKTTIITGISLMALGMLEAIISAGTEWVPVIGLLAIVVGGAMLMFSVVLERFEEWDAAHPVEEAPVTKTPTDV